MITLTTGVPGSGKTLYTLAYVKAKAERENRPVYYSGIPDLKLPWLELDDPTQWHTLPAGSIIVIDECQRVFRPRGTGSQVPEYIAKFETHRHQGLDIFLLTQHPMLVDQNIRRLVGQHFHAVRKFGLQAATINEWGSCHEITKANLLAAVKHKFTYPKEVFGYYKSAELHTHKRNVPMRVYLLALVPVVLVACAFTAYKVYQSRSDVAGNMAKATGQPQVAQVNNGTTGGKSSGPSAAGRISAAEYVDSFVPRVAGLSYTAPVFDDVTKVTEAPFPDGCIRSSKSCVCYSSQGTRLDMPASMCGQIVEKGIFKPFANRTALASRQEGSRSGPTGGYPVGPMAMNGPLP